MSATLLNQLLAPFVFSLFACAFCAVWLVRREWWSAALFAISYAFAAIAFLIEVLPRDALPVNTLRYVGDIFYSLSSAVFLFGIQRRFKISYSFLGAIVLFAIITAWHTYFRFVDPDIVARARGITMGTSAFLAVATVQTFVHGKSLADRVLYGFLGLFVVSLFISTLVTVSVDGELTNENFADSVMRAVINLVVTASALAVALTILLDFILIAYNSVRQQSETDDLTGLLNRRGFEKGVETQLKYDQEAALILADLDYFKTINDKHGHLAGDNALRHFADIVKTTVRQSDLSGRIGGEEFCVLLPGASARGAGGLAERIRERLRDSRLPNLPDDCRLTASFGVTQTQKGDDYLALFNRADRALYQAKQRGRDRVEITQ